MRGRTGSYRYRKTWVNTLRVIWVTTSVTRRCPDLRKLLQTAKSPIRVLQVSSAGFPNLAAHPSLRPKQQSKEAALSPQIPPSSTRIRHEGVLALGFEAPGSQGLTFNCCVCTVIFVEAAPVAALLHKSANLDRKCLQAP